MRQAVIDYKNTPGKEKNENLKHMPEVSNTFQVLAYMIMWYFKVSMCSFLVITQLGLLASTLAIYKQLVP